jgi:hypothetical protein
LLPVMPLPALSPQTLGYSPSIRWRIKKQASIQISRSSAV